MRFFFFRSLSSFASDEHDLVRSLEPDPTGPANRENENLGANENLQNKKTEIGAIFAKSKKQLASKLPAPAIDFFTQFHVSHIGQAVCFNGLPYAYLSTK